MNQPHHNVIPPRVEISNVPPACTDIRGASRYTGIPVSSIYDLRKAGDFPEPVCLSAKRRGYLIAELAEWLAGRPRAGA